MRHFSHIHRAIYDDQGNIILLSDQQEDTEDDLDTSGAHVSTSRSAQHHALTVPNMSAEESPISVKRSATNAALGTATCMDGSLSSSRNYIHDAEHNRRTVLAWLRNVLSEGRNQMRATRDGTALAWRALSHALRIFPSQCSSFLLRLPTIATSPLYFGHKRPSKPRSRFTLFCMDAVRFGSTFAFIFSFLFVALNYESFFSIAKADLALGDSIRVKQELSDLLQTSELGNIPSAGSISKGASQPIGLLDYLPNVGPPDNYILLQSLGVIAPLIDPPTDALVNEDWKLFEKQIQDSLLHGVVHYPGSANPGQAGNAFFTGHSSYYPLVQSAYKDVFALLGKLQIGDTYSVYYRGDLHMYKIEHIKEVRPSDVSVLDQPTDRRMSTLMTCTPVGTTLRRLIVQANEIDPVTHEALQVGERNTSQKSNVVKLDQLPI